MKLSIYLIQKSFPLEKRGKGSEGRGSLNGLQRKREPLHIYTVIAAETKD